MELAEDRQNTYELFLYKGSGNVTIYSIEKLTPPLSCSTGLVNIDYLVVSVETGKTHREEFLKFSKYEIILRTLLAPSSVSGKYSSSLIVSSHIILIL